MIVYSFITRDEDDYHYVSKHFYSTPGLAQAALVLALTPAALAVSSRVIIVDQGQNILDETALSGVYVEGHAICGDVFALEQAP